VRRFSDDDSGQLILIACVFIAAALVLISAYEYSTLGTGEKSINRETLNSYDYYNNIRDRYVDLYKDYNYRGTIIQYETELKEYALLHGASVDFIHNGTQVTIIFKDKDLKIEEVVIGG
jgi:hypothetical protein